MKIKELKHKYPLVYAAAMENQRVQGNKPNDEVDLDLPVYGFWWDESAEGREFWLLIDTSQFAKARELYPHLLPNYIVKTFHIVWMIPDRDEPVSTGKNYEAGTMSEALELHMNHVGIEPVAIMMK